LATAMSPNGRYVVFNSEVDNLAPGDGDGVVDVFIRDRKAGTTKLVSLANNGANGANHSGYQGGLGGYDTMAVSNDGRFVAFDSYADNLVDGDDGNGWIDLFLRDMKQDKTKLLSATPAGNSGNDESAYYSATMTPDARWVAFNSGADNLVGSDSNGSTYDIFIRGPLR
jgi:TolB protein